MTTFINKYVSRITLAVIVVIGIIVALGEARYAWEECPIGTQKIRLYNGGVACAANLQEPIQ
jgi:hypothetical protein